MVLVYLGGQMLTRHLPIYCNVILLFLGPPQIISSSKQSGVVGENVHINCAAITIPQPKNDEIVWMYHESKISEGTLQGLNLVFSIASQFSPLPDYTLN